MTRYYYSDDPTARGDQIAEEMRDYYEAHRETWWQRSRFNPNRFAVGLVADNLMLGLLAVADHARATAAANDKQNACPHPSELRVGEGSIILGKPNAPGAWRWRCLRCGHVEDSA